MQADKKDTAFLGHPVGLGWLSASEFWERFAYYGALLSSPYTSHTIFWSPDASNT